MCFENVRHGIGSIGDVLPMFCNIMQFLSLLPKGGECSDRREGSSLDHATVHVVRCWLLIAEHWVQS
jgi:hypothetical protein